MKHDTENTISNANDMVGKVKAAVKMFHITDKKLEENLHILEAQWKPLSQTRLICQLIFDFEKKIIRVRKYGCSSCDAQEWGHYPGEYEMTFLEFYSHKKFNFLWKLFTLLIYFLSLWNAEKPKKVKNAEHHRKFIVLRVHEWSHRNLRGAVKIRKPKMPALHHLLEYAFDMDSLEFHLVLAFSEHLQHYPHKGINAH